ncbi:MAG: hypothetical protein ACXWJX_16115 [Limisphaerales bacterium]
MDRSFARPSINRRSFHLTNSASGDRNVCFKNDTIAAIDFSSIDSNITINLNYIYAFNDQHPQTWINQNVYVISWLGVLWLLAFWPTH